MTVKLSARLFVCLFILAGCQTVAPWGEVLKEDDWTSDPLGQTLEQQSISPKAASGGLAQQVVVVGVTKTIGPIDSRGISRNANVQDRRFSAYLQQLWRCHVHDQSTHRDRSGGEEQLLREDPVARREFYFGDPERYTIKVNQFYLLKPIGTNWSLAFDYANESMSGASPWGAIANDEGNQQLIMSAPPSTIRATKSGNRDTLPAGGCLVGDGGRFEEHDCNSDSLVWLGSGLTLKNTARC